MKSIKNAILFFTLIVITSCTTQTKESLLEDFQEFITEVNDHHQDYSAKDWAKKDKEFKKFKQVIADKYKKELTFNDELTLGKHEITYNLMQLKKEAPNFLNLFKGDFEKLSKELKNYTENEMSGDVKKIKAEIEKATKQLKYYTENDMKDDIAKFKEEAKKMGKDFDKMGKEVEKALEELFKELEKK